MRDVTPGRQQRVGDLQMGEVPRLWAEALRLVDLAQVVDDTYHRDNGLSDRRFDESHAGGHRSYMAAYSTLQGACEHIGALQTLLAHHGATPRVPWTILRAVFELGAWANWLLEPDHGWDRRFRGLRFEVRSDEARRNFYDDFLEHEPGERAKRAREHLAAGQTYRAEAQALGADWGRVCDKINMVDELKKMRAVLAMEPRLQGPTKALWRSLSGMQHGEMYALVLNSDIHDKKQIPGGYRTVMSINDLQFQATASAGALLIARGADLYIHRSTKATKVPGGPLDKNTPRQRKTRRNRDRGHTS